VCPGGGFLLPLPGRRGREETMIDLSSGVYTTKYMIFQKYLAEWNVNNKRHGELLGRIVYFRGWKQYVFQPETGTEYNNSCLTEIVNVLTALNAKGSAPSGD
jgi:hypothetical protein